MLRLLWLLVILVVAGVAYWSITEIAKLRTADRQITTRTCPVLFEAPLHAAVRALGDLALDRALGRVDVGHRHRAVHDERLHFLQRAAEDAGDVRALVALGQADRLTEVVLLEELRELGRELAGLDLRLAKVPPLLDRDRKRPDGHDGENNYDAFGEAAHLAPKVKQRELHLDVSPSVGYLSSLNWKLCWTS